MLNEGADTVPEVAVGTDARQQEVRQRLPAASKGNITQDAYNRARQKVRQMRAVWLQRGGTRAAHSVTVVPQTDNSTVFHSLRSA